jgi:dUTP pyrophosphatase
VQVPIVRLPEHEDLPCPAYATAGSAGVDLHAAIREAVTVRMGEIALIPTGIRIAVPPGHEGQVRARSGLALRAGLALVNAPGTIDSDFRGEIQVIVTCLKAAPCTIRRGDRIAQLVIAPISRAEFLPVGSLDDTPRGAQGFGHTGVAGLETA